MDLLGRKLGLNKGKAVMDLFGEIQRTINDAKAIEATADLAASTEKVANKLGEVAMHMGATAMSEKVLNAFAFAHPFMDVCGDVAMAWQLLWRASIAAQKMEKAKKKDLSFYEGQMKSAEYFIRSVLPITLGKMNAILNNNGAAVEISEDAFGAK
jgi:hypothetical protein